MDPDLLGSVAALTPGQQRWLRTVLQSIVTMEPPRRRREEEGEERSERPRRRKGAEAAEKPRSRGLDRLLEGEGAPEEEYPELAEELKGIADIADLLREGGRERRRFGEELMRLFEAGDVSSGEEEEDEDADKGVHFN